MLIALTMLGTFNCWSSKIISRALSIISASGTLVPIHYSPWKPIDNEETLFLIIFYNILFNFVTPQTGFIEKDKL